MLKQYQKLMVSIVLILITIIGLFYWIAADFGENSTTEGLQESLQTAVTANRDQSARAEKGLYLLDRQGYEKGFLSTLGSQQGMSVDLKKENIMFTYLIDPKGSTLNDKVVKLDGTKVTNDYTKVTSRYIAIKGARVLIDANKNGVFTDAEDFVATVLVDTIDDGFDINGKGSIDGLSDGITVTEEPAK